MNRLLTCVFAALPLLAAAGENPRRVLDDRRHHLGVAGLPEWREFEGTTPEGRQLDLTFDARANAEEATLFIRQRDVKAAWQVTLNGAPLGTLEALSQPLVRALAVPPHVLKEGANRLSIAARTAVDDIVIDKIALETRPLDVALGEATLDIHVVETDAGPGLPCRLTLTDTSGALVPLTAAAGQRLALRTGVVYTGDGRARLRVAAGEYVLYASRGFEYSVATRRVSIAAGATQSIGLSLVREVPTPGLVACDSHIHTLTHSKHGDATIDERMLTIAGEGIELAIATDHNHHTDYAPIAARAGVAAHFTSVVGNEVTTKVGHFNAFPVRADGPLPDAGLADWPALLQNIRKVTGAKVITLNHPRDMHDQFTPFGPANFDAATGTLKSGPVFDCDAIEVVTSAAMQSDIMLLYRDWFALLNRGYRVAAIAASDTHHVSEFILGQARTYVACAAADPAKIDLDEVCESYLRGRLLVSLGLLTRMTVNDRFGVGDLATGLGPEVTVAVEVFGPSWVTADRVELFANGEKVREAAIAPTADPRKAQVRWTLPRPAADVHLVAIATGPGVTAPYWEIPRPYQASSRDFTPRVIGSTNPIWLDGDGDGRFSAAGARR